MGIESSIPAFESSRSAGAELSTKKLALGEELPVFCEKCGYALHGMKQHVCELCTVRQFHCPECGHHQPINTLRPAFQKILGRVRAFALALLVFFKINFFAWITFAWFGMGASWSYQYDYTQSRLRLSTLNSANVGQPASKKLRAFRDENYLPREVDMEEMFAFCLFGLAYGAFGRMFLLRWRRGWRVGLVLSAVTLAAILGGAYLTKYSRELEQSFLSGSFCGVLAATAASLTLGASVVWGVWTAMVLLLLPKKAGPALLRWQADQSNPPAASLARD